MHVNDLVFYEIGIHSSMFQGRLIEAGVGYGVFSFGEF